MSTETVVVGPCACCGGSSSSSAGPGPVCVDCCEYPVPAVLRVATVATFNCPCMETLDGEIVYNPDTNEWLGTITLGSCGYSLSFRMYCEAGTWKMQVYGDCGGSPVDQTLVASGACEATFDMSFFTFSSELGCGCGLGADTGFRVYSETTMSGVCTACAPVPVAETLYCHFVLTAGPCSIDANVVLTHNAGVWSGSAGGACPLDITFFCSGGVWTLYYDLAGSLGGGEVTSAQYSPYFLVTGDFTGTFLAEGSVCCDPGPGSQTLTYQVVE